MDIFNAEFSESEITAYNQGFKAWREGDKEIKNPYTVETSEAVMWVAGFYSEFPEKTCV